MAALIMMCELPANAVACRGIPRATFDGLSSIGSNDLNSVELGL